MGEIRPFYRNYFEAEIQDMQLKLVRRIEEKTEVVDAGTGYVVCMDVNHDIDPDVLDWAAKITVASFLSRLPKGLQPQKIVGVPRRGVEFAGALSYETRLRTGVAEKKEMNGGGEYTFSARYEKEIETVIFDGIPSFTEPGKFYSHRIRAIQPGMTILVADDFSAKGSVTERYNEGFAQLDITPVYVYMVAKDFQDLRPPQIGYRTNKLAGLPVFAPIRITEMIGGTGGRVRATSEDIRV